MPARSSLVALASAVALAAQSPREAEVKATHVAGSVHMLEGQGGNIGLCVGEDGPFLIDDQFATMTGKITAAVATLSERPIRFVINTHWHGDHTGGNENLGGAGAVIVAHENVRRRMSQEQFIEAFDMRTPPAPEAALPVITFTKDITLHLNDEEVHVFHVAGAHTDGDSIIHFRAANVIHMGDVYFNGMYPFIDAATGGSVAGVIAAVDHVLGVANASTKIIPGHGPLSGTAELRAYRDMLASVRERVQKLIDAGKGREEVIAARPTADFDAAWGGGFLKPDAWVGILYEALKPRAATGSAPTGR